jgi:hypothetical protein
MDSPSSSRDETTVPMIVMPMDLGDDDEPMVPEATDPPRGFHSLPLQRPPQTSDIPAAPKRSWNLLRNPTMKRVLSIAVRRPAMSARQRHQVETARVAAVLSSVQTRARQPELYTVEDDYESVEEPAAAHAAPRTVQESKELLDRLERMRKFKSHDYEPPVRIRPPEFEFKQPESDTSIFSTKQNP